MLQASAIFCGFIMIFMLVSGLIVLWHRGSDDLDTWGSSAPPASPKSTATCCRAVQSAHHQRRHRSAYLPRATQEPP